MIETISSFELGDTTLAYQKDKDTNQVGFVFYPTKTAPLLAKCREEVDDYEIQYFVESWLPMKAWQLEERSPRS